MRKKKAFTQPEAAEHVSAGAQTTFRRSAAGILIHGFNTSKQNSINRVLETIESLWTDSVIGSEYELQTKRNEDRFGRYLPVRTANIVIFDCAKGRLHDSPLGGSNKLQSYPSRPL